MVPNLIFRTNILTILVRRSLSRIRKRSFTRPRLCIVLEGNSWQNYNSSNGGGCGTPDCFYSPISGGYPNAFVILPLEAEGHPTPSPGTMAIVFRRSSAVSNAGVWIGESSWNTLLEGTSVAAADSCVTVDTSGVDLFYERGTSCP